MRECVVDMVLEDLYQDGVYTRGAMERHLDRKRECMRMREKRVGRGSVRDKEEVIEMARVYERE